MGVYYSIDKIEINFILDLKVLRDLLPIEKLEREYRQILFLFAGEKAQKYGYKSKMIITVPSKKCFELLALSGLEDDDYRITCIELAKDVVKESMHEAILESWKQINSIRKKYTADTFTYDGRDSCTLTKISFDEGKFSEMTGYFKSRTLEFVVYARNSKITGQPCIHSEWCVRGSANIKERLGIETFDDCFDLDIKQEYEKLTAKYIVLEEIDHEKLGKWILGWGRRNNFTKRQIMSICMAAQTMLSAEDITTAAQLTEFFKKEKERIKSQRGMKSDWDKKIKSLLSNCRFSVGVAL